MKIIKESKQEKLPIEFLTQNVSRFWDEVGNLKASIEGIKKEFAGTKEVEKILQDLVDAYLIAIGQLELHLDKKEYVELPEKEEVKESLKEDLDEEPVIANAPEKVEKINDGEKVELHTELPDYDVEVEQKGDKVEVEVEPKEEIISEKPVELPVEDEWPEPDMSDTRDIDAARDAVKNMQIINNNKEDEIRSEMPVPEFVKNETSSKEPIEVNGFMEVDFPEAEPDEEADEAVRAWLRK